MPKPTRLLVLAALALSSIVLIAQPAGATPPSVQTIHEEAEFVFADCGTFLLNETVTVNVRTTTFFDAQGNAVSTTDHANVVGVITNSVSGNTYPDNAHLQVVTDLTTGEVTVTGLAHLTTVPGLGLVLNGDGRVVFDADGNITFIAGKHNVLLGTAPDPCTVLL
jgi:hypothetical protein